MISASRCISVAEASQEGANCIPLTDCFLAPEKAIQTSWKDMIRLVEAGDPAQLTNTLPPGLHFIVSLVTRVYGGVGTLMRSP